MSKTKDAHIAVIAARAKRDAIAQKVAMLRDELAAAEADERRAFAELEKKNREYNEAVQEHNADALRASRS